MFDKTKIGDEFENRRKVIHEYLKGKDSNFFNTYDVDYIVEDLYSIYSIEPIVIDIVPFDKKIIESSKEFSSPKPRGNGSIITSHNGYQYTAKYRFSGNEVIFLLDSGYQVTLLGANPPAIYYSDGVMQIILFEFEDAVNRDKDILDNTSKQVISSMQKMIDYSNEKVTKFNEQLKVFISNEISKRKEKIDFLGELRKKYKIEVDIQNPEIVEITRRIRHIGNISSSSGGDMNSNYSIDEMIYIEILSLVKHYLSTLERIPNTCSKLDEEEIRDLLLSALNGVFRGQANGEAFSRNGKTDILIESNTRYAFIAELKIWSGIKKFEDALNQLLSYSTWRDNKLSLIVFTRDTSLFTVTKEISSFLDGHLDKVYFKVIDTNEFEFKCYAKDDDGKIMRIRVYVIDIRVSK